jgi:acetyltransferase-like isoleucine patch superfamily enzyme
VKSVVKKICNYFYAKYRAFAPVSCFASPRPDVVWGFTRWRWLVEMRRSGILVDPSVELRSSGDFRNRLFLRKGVAIDKGSILHLGNDCGEDGVIQMGRGVYVGPYCQIVSSHRLEIGENSLIGGFSYLITVNHRTDQIGLPVGKQGYRGANIKIGKNVWLGAHVMVLPGVEIGDNAVIGAGAVVTKSIPAGETWVGVPAKSTLNHG